VGSAASRTSASSGEGAGKHGRARSAAASLEIERPRETRGRQGALADAPGGGPGPSGAAARICRTASGSSTVAITRSRPPPRRQANTSIANARRMRAAQGPVAERGRGTLPTHAVRRLLAALGLAPERPPGRPSQPSRNRQRKRGYSVCCNPVIFLVAEADSHQRPLGYEGNSSRDANRVLTKATASFRVPA
jgi:hypothetical protein